MTPRAIALGGIAPEPQPERASGDVGGAVRRYLGDFLSNAPRSVEELLDDANPALLNRTQSVLPGRAVVAPGGSVQQMRYELLDACFLPPPPLIETERLLDPEFRNPNVEQVQYNAHRAHRNCGRNARLVLADGREYPINADLSRSHEPVRVVIDGVLQEFVYDRICDDQFGSFYRYRTHVAAALDARREAVVATTGTGTGFDAMTAATRDALDALQRSLDMQIMSGTALPSAEDGIKPTRVVTRDAYGNWTFTNER